MAQFIKTGAVLGAPAPRGVASNPVRAQGSDVEVEVWVRAYWLDRRQPW